MGAAELRGYPTSSRVFNRFRYRLGLGIAHWVKLGELFPLKSSFLGET